MKHYASPDFWACFAKFIGIVGFGAGFIGPAIVSPGSNQGPLFGIIISGPLSFLYGLFVGFLPAMFPIFKNVRYDMLKFTGALICAAAVMVMPDTV